MDPTATSRDGSASAVCVVCEHGSLWGAHLKHRLRAAAIIVKRCARRAEVWQHLQQSPASILLLEASKTDLDRVFDVVWRVSSRFPDVRVIVVLPRGYQHQQWWFREAGAVHVVHSICQLSSVVRIVRRHVMRAPATEMTWTQRVYARLPWNV